MTDPRADPGAAASAASAMTGDPVVVDDPVVTGDPTPRQISEVRAHAATLLTLLALLGVAAVVFGTVETQVFLGALGVVGGLATVSMLRHPERFVRGPDLDAFAKLVTDGGGLPPHPDESDRSLRVRLLEGMERVRERVDDVRERRQTAWLVGLSLVIVPVGFMIPFLRLWNLGLLALVVLHLIAQRLDRVPKRRRAAEALRLLELQLAQLSRDEPETLGPAHPELTSGA